MKVKIRTSIPGPRSLELAKRRQDSVANGHGSVCGIYIEEAIGSNLIDVDGNIFIDYAGGIGTMNVGHSHPKVIDAINKQMNQYVHTCFTVAPYEPYVNLAQRLADIVPIKGDCKSVFFNSGAEAVENAIKISKTYTGRSDILVFSHAYHGRTQMTMSMTYKEDPYKKGFGPFLDNVHRVDFPKQGFDLSSLKIDPRSLACVVIEPVAGEGGFIPVSHDAMGQIRTFCDDNDIVMVADEVQTGFGRVGNNFWAFSEHDVVPDIVTLGKPMGNGYPIAAVVTTDEIAQTYNKEYGYFNTFGGNPVACAAGLAVLEVIKKDQLMKHAKSTGLYFYQELIKLAGKYELISDVRGCGLFLGVRCFFCHLEISR